MKLWHDDVRPPPAGWTWARTNEKARELLLNNEVEEISMDHDLGLHVLDVPEGDADDYWDKVIEIANTVTDGEETGLDLVEWMILNKKVPPKVTIHSWNEAGAKRMALRLVDHDYECWIAPFQPPK